MMMALNICYSTCLGRIDNHYTSTSCGYLLKRIGVTFNTLCLDNLRIPEDIHITTSGVAFVKPHIRVGVIPSILREFLMTRVMLKDSSKLY
jgi:DNA polymerase zeta